MDYQTARNPVYASPNNSSISLTLVSTDFGDLDYTVEAYDPDPFAIEIFIRAINGDFGDVAPYTQPNL